MGKSAVSELECFQKIMTQDRLTGGRKAGVKKGKKKPRRAACKLDLQGAHNGRRLFLRGLAYNLTRLYRPVNNKKQFLEYFPPKKSIEI